MLTRVGDGLVSVLSVVVAVLVMVEVVVVGAGLESVVEDTVTVLQLMRQHFW